MAGPTALWCLVMPFLLLASAGSFTAACLGMAFRIMAAFFVLAGVLVYRFHIGFRLGIRFALTALRL
jgi:hypothetical protein